MNRLIVKRLLLAAGLAATAALAACEEPRQDNDYEAVEIQTEEPTAPAAEDSGAPVVAEAPAAKEATTPVEAIPHDERTSEQTVQPESDTLFY